MERGVGDEEQPPTTDAKRPYERPVLEVLGSVAALTRGGFGVGEDFGFTAFS